MNGEGVPIVLVAEVVEDGEGQGVQVGWVGVIFRGCGRCGDEVC